MNNKHQGIVSIYLSYALDGDHIPITGKKDRVRQIVHVEDVCAALYLAISQDKETKNQIYNVTCEELCTPERIIDNISKCLYKDINIVEKPGYVGDQVYISGKNDKLKSLGWTPKYNLQLGVQQFCSNIGGYK